ncbi:O-antigen ligase family protein [Halopseudomonas pachastrellae]|uniref:O-antigen ligase family protein n=1 Tax=Halopseudomonas pachastrellae TaxID=254161 RepID=UPI003D7DC305
MSASELAFVKGEAESGSTAVRIARVLPFFLWVCASQWLLYGVSLLSYSLFGVLLAFVVSVRAMALSGLFRILGLIIVLLLMSLSQWLSYAEHVPLWSPYRVIHIIAAGIACWLLMPQGQLFRAVKALPLLNSMFFLVVFMLGLVNGQTMQAAEWSVFMLETLCFSAALFLWGHRQRGLWGYVLLVFLLLVLMTFSNVTALSETIALGEWSRVFSMAGHLLFVAAIYIWGRNESGAATVVLVGMACCIVFYSMYMVAFWISLDNPATYRWFSAPPLFQHIRHQGYLLCGLAVGAAFLFLKSQQPSRVPQLLVFLSFSLLFWNGGRGAILGVVVGVLILGVGFPFRDYCQRCWRILIIALLALCVSAIFRVEERGVGWLNALFRSEAESINGLSSGRLFIWARLIEPIQERIWFGWGGDGFKSVWTGSSLIIQAHNGLLQMLLEWGGGATAILCGAMLVMLALGTRAALAARASVLEPTSILLLGLGLSFAYLTLAVFDGVFYYATPGAYLALGFGMTWAGLVNRT